jgi:rare lipoprotein A
VRAEASCLLLVFLAGCAREGSPSKTPDQPRVYPSSAPAPGAQEGQATYYSDALAGHATASGERYDPHALSAAHRTLPFGTDVRVTRIDSGRSVVVRINDRGPFGNERRIIDLSRAAAEQIDMIRAGVVPVRLEVLPR